MGKGGRGREEASAATWEKEGGRGNERRRWIRPGCVHLGGWVGTGAARGGLGRGVNR
jgi:hypothetical protein